MSRIAKLLTGMTDREFFEATPPTVGSAEAFFVPRGVSPRQSVRIAAGMIEGIEDRNPRRAELRSKVPSALRPRWNQKAIATIVKL